MPDAPLGSRRAARHAAQPTPPARRRVRTALAAVGLVTGAVGVTAGFQLASGENSSGDGVTVHKVENVGELDDYWTPERMRDATPR